MVLTSRSTHSFRTTTRRALYQTSNRLVYLGQTLSQRVRRRQSRRVKKLGLVTFEFFRADLNGFGGYGKLVQNITDYCNTRSQRLRADVLIAIAQRSPAYVERCHNADVIFKFKDKGSMLRNLWSYPRYLALLGGRQIDLLMTIEYYTRYEHHVHKLSATPVLIWLQDPRSVREWQTIGTVTLADDVELARTDGVRWVEESRQSLHRLIETSRILKRTVAFAHQAECLVPNAQALYGIPNLRSTFLPNPIDVPAKLAEKTSTPSVCFLGRLDPIKRPWIFFELAKRFSHVQFLVAGETHHPKSMGALIDRYRAVPNLKFLGLVDGDAKHELLQRSWALVNTSIHEALPVSFLESFAAATPVVSCRNPDGLVQRFGVYTGEMLGNGTDERSLAAFERALKHILSNTEERVYKGAAARAYVQQTHTYEQFEEKLHHIIQEMDVARWGHA